MERADAGSKQLKVFMNGYMPLEMIPVDVPKGQHFPDVIRQMVAKFLMPQLRTFYDVSTAELYATDEAYKINITKIFPRGINVCVVLGQKYIHASDNTCMSVHSCLMTRARMYQEQ